MKSPARRARNASPANGGARHTFPLIPAKAGIAALGPRLREDEWQNATRDYYLVEDSDGHRFWLFREGLYGRETAAARWFVHGLFA